MISDKNREAGRRIVTNGVGMPYAGHLNTSVSMADVWAEWASRCPSEPEPVQRKPREPSHWTPEKLAALRGLWDAGYPCRSIATLLGPQFTKAAVISKARVLGLERRRLTNRWARPGAISYAGYDGTR